MPKNEAQIDEADLDGLARACARRFPTAEAQRPFARAAGLDADPTDVGDAVATWAKMLRAAQARGRLVDLARALARAAPGDENLVALARALGVAAAPSTMSPSPLVLGIVGLVLLAAAGLAWTFAPGKPAGTPATTAAATAPPPTPLPAVEPAPEPPSEPAGEPVAEPAFAAPAPTTASTSTSTSKSTAATARSSSRSPCSGYFYFGRSTPGAAGQTITLGRDARVRADYPRAENGHDAAAPERCVLTRGTQVLLTSEPIDASNGHYWVPVGDP